MLICYTHKVSPLVSLTVMTFRLMLRGTDQTLDLLASTAAPESRRRSRRRRIVPFDAATVPHRTNSLFFRTLMHFFGLPCPLGKGGYFDETASRKSSGSRLVGPALQPAMRTDMFPSEACGIRLFRPRLSRKAVV